MFNKDMVLCFIDNGGKSNYHLGAAYMIANLKQYGYNADLYVNYQNKSLNQTVEAILSENTKCVGFTLYDTNFFLVKELCNKIKEKNKDIFVFLGGATATFCYEKILNDCNMCDGCILFEGETTAIEIMQYLNHEIKKSQIKNFVYRNETGEIIKNESRDVSLNLDEFPSPYLTGVINPIDYYQNHKNSWHRMVQLISSRGCVFSCKYCSNVILGHNIIRTHSIDRVIEEMKFLKKIFEENKIKPRIQFMDDIFTFCKERTLEFCNRLIEEKVGLEFAIQTRPDCIDEEQIKKLALAGCCAINYGMENSNPDILYNMGKCPRRNESNERNKEVNYIQATEQAVKWANDNKIYTAVNMIYGWEGQTYESHMQDINFLNQLGADYTNTASLIYYPGTEIYQPAVDKVKSKIEYIENNCGLIFSLTYDFFPQLYPFRHEDTLNSESESSAYFNIRKKAIIRSIMGIQNTNELKTIVYEDDYPDFDWLKENVNLTSDIVFVKSSDFKNWYFSTYAFAYDYKMKKFICQYDHFYKDIEKTDMNIDMFVDNKVEANLFSLDDSSSVKEFFEDIKSKSIYEIAEEFSITKSNKMIYNYCRWCSSENKCPAENLSKIMINNGGIYTCHGGVRICDIDPIMDWDVVKNKIKKMFYEAAERRGCNSCEIKNSCSKCISLGEISDEKYCELQKKRPKRKNKIIYDIKKVENFSE